MMEPGSAVPFKVGVLSLVLPSPGVPVSEAGSRVMPGATGARLSIVTARTAVAGLSPATFVSVAEYECTPLVRFVRLNGAVPAVIMPEVTVTVPTSVRPSYSLITSPTCVPAPRPTSRSIVVSLVMLSVELAPVSLAVTRSTPVGRLSVVKFQSVALARPA